MAPRRRFCPRLQPQRLPSTDGDRLRLRHLPKSHIGRQRRVVQGACTRRAARVDNNANGLELLFCRPARVLDLERTSPIDHLDKVRVGAVQSTWRAQIPNFHRTHFRDGEESEKDRGLQEERMPRFSLPITLFPSHPHGGKPSDLRMDFQYRRSADPSQPRPAGQASCSQGWIFAL